MFARHSGTLGNLIPVSAVIVTLAAASLAAVPAHGFGLKLSWEDAMEAATDDLNALEKEDSAQNRKSPGQERIDREIDQFAGKAADKAERGMWKVGEKTWKRLEKTKTLGSTMKKLGKRWGPAAKMGTRLSPHVGTALTVWDFTYAVGDKLIAPQVVSAIEGRFENKWKEQEEGLRQDMEHYRKLGEQRRQHKKDVLDVLAVGHALRQLREDKEGPWATTDDPRGEKSQKTNAAPRGADDPGAKNDPWAPETPDARIRRTVAVGAAPGRVEVQKDPWAPETPDVRTRQSAAVEVATPPVVAQETKTGPSNYEKALNALQGEGTQSAGYEKALEKLETDRRLERGRRQVEAEAARQRQIARAAEQRRLKAEREAAAQREAAAREWERQQELDRAARERRQYSTPSYNPGYNQTTRQIDRAMQTLRQTRQQQQRAYQIQKARQQQLQRQRQMEQARRQRIYEQQRAWDRRTYQPYGPGPSSSGSRSSSGSTFRCPHPDGFGCSQQ